MFHFVFWQVQRETTSKRIFDYNYDLQREGSNFNYLDNASAPYFSKMKKLSNFTILYDPRYKPEFLRRVASFLDVGVRGCLN